MYDCHGRINKKRLMKFLFLLLLVLVIYPDTVNAKTQTFNFTVQNNTVLDFEKGYYIIEVIEVNADSLKFVKANVTVNGRTKIFNFYEGENPYLIKPYDKIDLRVNSITKTEANMLVIFPAEWGYPENYIIPGKVESLKIPQIVLTKSVDKTKINTGDVVEIKIIAENKGNGTAYNLTLTEELPQGFSRAPGSRFPPRIQDILGAGERQELYYALKAVEPGTFNIEPTTVTYGLNSSKSNSVKLEISEEKSDLITAISIDSDSVKTDDMIRADVKITNVGRKSATSILIDGNIPSGLVAIEGDLRQVYREIYPNESKEYTVVLKAIEPGSYSINLKTFYNDNMGGAASASKPIIVTKAEKDYLRIIIPAAIIIIAIAIPLKRHREYSF